MSAIHKKLRIQPGMKLLTVSAPPEFSTIINDPAMDLTVSPAVKDYDQIHWFVKSKSEMEKSMSKILGLLKTDVICWIYYPKGSSGIQTDLSRDKGWDKLLAQTNLQWLSLVSLDNTWSTFAMRLAVEGPVKKSPTLKPNPISAYIDPVKKLIRVPDDLQNEFKKDKAAAAFFDQLSFTNKKEYIEWIVTAKKEETRLARLAGTITKLREGWKNPNNR